MRTAVTQAYHVDAPPAHLDPPHGLEPDADAGLGLDQLAQHPLRRAAPAQEGGQPVRQRGLHRTGRVQRRHHVGQPRKQFGVATGEKSVRLVQLRDPGPSPAGGRTDLRRPSGRVPFEEGDRMPLARKGERAGHPRRAGPAHRDPQPSVTAFPTFHARSLPCRISRCPGPGSRPTTTRSCFLRPAGGRDTRDHSRDCRPSPNTARRWSSRAPARTGLVRKPTCPSGRIR